MTAKKILNAADDVVEDYIRSLVGAGAGLNRVAGWPVIVRATRKAADRVALVSGGGSGHEPAHAGYVGEGMLDAAVLGPVFTSPSVDAVHAAIRAVATDAGVLLIIKNYTGDRLNFGLAAELARAEGIPVETVIVADDAALGDTSRAGRRGLTATVLVHKVAGAAAERGLPLAEVAALAERFLAGAATMGVALGPCTVPGADAPNFALGADEIEWGLGIHGEAGSERGQILPARELARRLVDTVVADLGTADLGRAPGDADGVVSGTDVVVLVNSLGGTPDLDLRILHGDVLDLVREKGLRVRLTWAGPFLTSLEMPGASVTIARVDEELVDLLAAPARVLAFPAATVELGDTPEPVPAPAPFAVEPGAHGGPASVLRAHAATAAVARALIDAESELTALDRQVGDGDLGTNLARGARSILAAETALRTQPSETAYFAALSDIVRREVGGTSGPLYSILLLALGEALPEDPDATAWTGALRAAVARVREVGGAAPGDSTMIDALQPAADAAEQGIGASAAAARAGAESTAALRPSLGRSSYLGDRAVGVPDPGAVAIAIELEAIAASVADPSC